MINIELTEQIHRFKDNVLALINFINKENNKEDYVSNQEYLTLNANFLYSFSLFERLVGEILRTTIKKNKGVKARYFEVFDSLALQKIKEGNTQHNWKKFFNQPKEMLDNFYIVEREKGQIVLAKILLDLDYKEEYFYSIHKQYCEIRERRNLFIHRGEEPDKIYYNTLNKKYKIDKKSIRKIFADTGLYLKYREWDKSAYQFVDKENDIKNPKNISVTPDYLFHSVSVLHSFALIILYNCWNFNSSDKIPPFNTVHDLLLFWYDNDCTKGFLDVMKTFLFYMSNKSDETKFIPDFTEKVNFLIVYDYLFTHKQISRKDVTNFELLKSQLLASLIDEGVEYENKEIMHQLTTAYLKNDIDLFIDGTKKLIETDVNTIHYIDRWLIFRKFRDRKKFKSKIKLTN